MTKKDMARAIAEETGIPQVQATAVVQRIFDGIIETLVTAGPDRTAQLRRLRGQEAQAQEGTQPPHRRDGEGAGQAGRHLQAGAGDGAAGQEVEEGSWA